MKILQLFLIKEDDVSTHQHQPDRHQRPPQPRPEQSGPSQELGATFLRTQLESNRNYLRITRGNVISSESVIRDADMAEEMMQFTRNQIMVASSTAMLAQANQQPRMVLGLIG